MPAIKKPFEYFNVVTYTGNGSARTISGVGFQPDFVWIKVRNTTGTHVLSDSVRGGNKQLFSNLTNAEGTATNKITGFTSDGFTLGADDGSGTGDVNYNGNTYVAWCWKASNASAVTNTAGTITSQVSANTTSGFSVVTYTGNGSNPATIGHGLGVAPKMIIAKSRSISPSSWVTYHASIGANQYLLLNTTGAQSGTDNNAWNSTNPTSSVFTVGSYSNTNGGTYVAYCFSEVQGYSKFGSYVGNGSSDGPFVFCGFRPRWVMVKSSTFAGAQWVIYDTTRDSKNFASNVLLANDSLAELVGNENHLDILANGFKARSSQPATNNSGSTYIYMAFAENPFKYSLAR